MFLIGQEKRGWFSGMVYHGECGWHSGFTPEYTDNNIVKYSTMEQATQQMMFLEEMFHENNLYVEEE